VRQAPVLVVLAGMLVGCGGGASGSTAPTAAATTLATAAPTVAAVRTNPPATPIPGCLPECVTGRLARPNAISGDYTTRNFFGGQLTVTVPDGWWGYEDSTSELSIGPAGSEVDRLEIWIDVYVAKDANGTPDESFERSAEAITAFVKAQQGIDILEDGPATLGGLPAEAIVYKRAADAINMDPNCPTEIQPCILEFGYPEWDGAFGEGGPFRSRLVIAKATWGGATHAVYAMFWADDSSYEADAAKAQAIVEGARLPAGVETAPMASP
jgi:hypothetical protein